MVVLLVIIVLVFVIMVWDSANAKKRKQEEQEEQQKVKTDIARAFGRISRTLEALDIIKSKLEVHDIRLYRYISAFPDKKFLFEITCIIASDGNPLAQKALDSIHAEEKMRIAAKDSGEPLPTKRGLDNYTIWYDLTDEQVDLLYDVITDLDQLRDEDDEDKIILKGLLPLPCDGYIYQVKMKTKALAEAIHEKFPEYGLEVKYYGGNATGIHFNDKSGVVSYENI